MASIDVRSNGDVEINQIVFGDGHDNDASCIELRNTYLRLADMDDSSGNCNIAYEDIDNLIKALQKAKEIKDSK